MRRLKLLQLGIGNGFLQGFILKLGHPAALGTYQVMVVFFVVRAFVLGGTAELVLDDQMCIDKQDNGVVEGRTTDAKLPLSHPVIECIDIEMSLDGVDGIEYSIAFGCLAMPVRLQIVGQYLPHFLFHVLFHLAFSS